MLWLKIEHFFNGIVNKDGTLNNVEITPDDYHAIRKSFNDLEDKFNRVREDKLNLERELEELKKFRLLGKQIVCAPYELEVLEKNSDISKKDLFKELSKFIEVLRNEEKLLNGRSINLHGIEMDYQEINHEKIIEYVNNMTLNDFLALSKNEVEWKDNKLKSLFIALYHIHVQPSKLSVVDMTRNYDNVKNCLTNWNKLTAAFPK